MKIRQIILPSLLLSGATVSADIVAHFPMDVKMARLPMSSADKNLQLKGISCRRICLVR